MADAIISIVVERLTVIIEKQIRNEVNLVRGVEKEIQSLCNELTTIRNVLDDAESRRFKDKNVNDWLSRLEHMSFEMEDVLDEWNYAILKHKMENESSDHVVAPKHKVRSFIPSSCLCFKKVAIRHDIARKINHVKAQLTEIVAEKDRYNFMTSQPTDPSWRVQSTSVVDLAEVYGRDLDRNILVRKLTPEGGSQEELGLHILSVVGVGGVGKTTLAQLVYNDSRVEECFELRIWICVSDPFDVVGVVKGIVERVKGGCPNTNQLDMLLQCLKNSVSVKKFLLVLDDVWTEDSAKWEPLKNSLKSGGAGSKILVTTRSERVAKTMGTIDNEIHYLGQLSDEECWLLLRRIALFGRNTEECEILKDIGKNIAKKCKGLPLAAKALGSLLRFKKTLEEWENVLNSEIWQLEEAKVELFPHLLLTYNELSPTLKQCFSYCAVFPKDHLIDVEILIGNWMAQGYLGSNTGDMELRGQEFFDNLAMRSLFQDIERSDLDGKIYYLCKMHDIVHDFAIFLQKNTSSGRVETSMKKTTCQSCNPSLVSHVLEYRRLSCEEGPAPHLCDCLRSLKVLRLKNCGLVSIPHEIEKMTHLRWLDLSVNKFSKEDLRRICKLYFLQVLWLHSCELEEIPWEIGHLIHLRHLDLSFNTSLKELPESICDLHELRILDVNYCYSLSGLPQGIHRLTNLIDLLNKDTISLKQFPAGLAQLTGLCTLRLFHGGTGMNKLGYLKNLNRLKGSLQLNIRLTNSNVVDDAREGELRNKIHIQQLNIVLHNKMDNEKNQDSVWEDVMDALEPHPNLQNLKIKFYKGSRLWGWIASPLNQLRCIKLYAFSHLLLLPPLGKLPLVEEVLLSGMLALQFVGREFLGITRITKAEGIDMDAESSSSSVSCANKTIGFPKLKKLTFHGCLKWKEWEDINAEEEDSAAVLVMPCLKKLIIKDCERLMALPHRLLRKVLSLEVLDISGSIQLEQHYGDKDGYSWKSISQNRQLQLGL